MSALIGLDGLFARACEFVENNEVAVLRNIRFQGDIHAGVELAVKAYSNHYETVAPGNSDADLSLQPWMDELGSAIALSDLPYPNVWTELVFKPFDYRATSGAEANDLGPILRQLIRAIVADWLLRRVQVQRPGAVR